MSAPGDPLPARHDPYAPWRLRDFRCYAVCWFLMVFAKQVETVAISVYLYRKTESPLSLGWAGLVQALPVILLAITGGHLADRFDRRRVLLLTLSTSALAAFGLLAYSLNGGGTILWIYACLALGAVAAALGGPSRAALLPQIVGVQSLSAAVTWSSTVFQVATMVSPALGTLLLLAAADASVALATVAAARVLAVLTLLTVRSHSAPAEPAAASLRALAAGIRFVWQTKPILATITLDLFAVLVGGATYLLPVLAKDLFGADPAYMGFLQSAEAIGAISMAMFLAHRRPMRRPGRAMLWAVAGFGAATIVLGLSRWFWLSLAMMFAIGACDNISVLVRHTLVQVLTPDSMRGRVSAVHNVFITASNDLGGFESGLAAWLFGLEAAVVGGGVGTILVVLAAARIWPQIVALGPLHELRAKKH